MYICSILFGAYLLPIGSYIVYTQSRLCAIIRAECRATCPNSQCVLTGRFKRAAELSRVARCKQNQGVLKNRHVYVILCICDLY